MNKIIRWAINKWWNERTLARLLFKGYKVTNLGQLIRNKMKELSEDKSGEYVDQSGRAFEMKLNGDAYTVSYGGGKKEIEITRQQAVKLVSHSRKLGG